MILLDTDVLIDVERRHPTAVEWITGLTFAPSVAGFAAMELTAGCRNAEELRRVAAFLTPMRVLWPGEVDMRDALENVMSLRLTSGIGVLDALIAVTAIGHGLPLATFNHKHIRDVPSLITVQPYVR